MIGLLLLTASWPGVQTDLPVDLPIRQTVLLQEEQEEKIEKAKKEEAEKEKPPPIPDLSAVDREKAKRFLNFLKNSNPDKRHDYEKKMVALGRGVLPLLLDKADTTHEHQSQGIDYCLLKLLDIRDREILDGFASSKNLRLRRIAVGMYAGAAREKDREILKAFLKDAEAEIRLKAAGGLVKLKDPSGIGEIILAAAACNEKEKAKLLEDLGRLKGKVFSSHFRPFAVKHEDPEVRKAAIEVIVAIGDMQIKDVLGQALNDDHNLVKAAAVNALRQLVKGEEPVTFPTVFDLVNSVEKWKKELGLIR